MCEVSCERMARRTSLFTRKTKSDKNQRGIWVRREMDTYNQSTRCPSLHSTVCDWITMILSRSRDKRTAARIDNVAWILSDVRRLRSLNIKKVVSTTNLFVSFDTSLEHRKKIIALAEFIVLFLQVRRWTFSVIPSGRYRLAHMRDSYFLDVIGYRTQLSDPPQLPRECAPTGEPNSIFDRLWAKTGQ